MDVVLKSRSVKPMPEATGIVDWNAAISYE
jgi:hypothetical protein